MMRARLFLALTPIVLTVGCSGGSGRYSPKEVKPVKVASIAPGQEATLFPLKVGNQWTFVMEVALSQGGQTRTGTRDVTLRVAAVVPMGDETRATIEVLNSEGKVEQRQEWSLTGKGLYQRSAGNPSIPFLPPQPALVFPFNPGGGFDWKGTGITPMGKAGNMTAHFVVRQPEEVDTDNGKVSAYPVDMLMEFEQGKDKGRVSAVIYWAPGVGISRYIQEMRLPGVSQTQVLRLKAYVVK